MNEPSLMQIVTSGPWSKRTNQSTLGVRRSKEVILQLQLLRP